MTRYVRLAMVTVWGVVAFLVIGALAGWLAGEVVRGYGFGLLGNIVVGVVGALLGGILFDAAGIGGEGGFLWTLFVAFIGAVVLLFIAGLVGRATTT